MTYNDVQYLVTISIGEDMPDPEPGEVIRALYQGIGSIDTQDAVLVELNPTITPAQYDALCAVIDDAKDAEQDTDVYAAAALRALGLNNPHER